MPFSGGTAGAHTNDMHLGNAKRDTFGGVAGLDTYGDLLVPGNIVRVTRDGSDDIFFIERTADEAYLGISRLGANDYDLQVHIGGAWQGLLHDGLRNVPDGLAGLDSNAFVRPDQASFMIEAYENHLGAVDNFTETATAGNGTATEDAANHEMDLSSGITNVGHALFRMKNDWVFAVKPMRVNFILKNFVAGTSSKFEAFAGFKNDFTSDLYEEHAVFHWDYSGIFRASTANGVSEQTTGVGAVVAGDVLSIVATSAKVMYFVNAVLVATHTTYIPTSTQKVGGSIVAYAAGAGAARLASIDYMSVRRYV